MKTVQNRTFFCDFYAFWKWRGANVIIFLWKGCQFQTRLRKYGLRRTIQIWPHILLFEEKRYFKKTNVQIKCPWTAGFWRVQSGNLPKGKSEVLHSHALGSTGWDWFNTLMWIIIKIVHINTIRKERKVYIYRNYCHFSVFNDGKLQPTDESILAAKVFPWT